MLEILDLYPLVSSLNRMVVISESSVFNKNITALALRTYTAYHRHVRYTMLRTASGAIGQLAKHNAGIRLVRNYRMCMCKHGDFCVLKSVYFASFG
jgi:hypothetical protein